MDAAQHPEPGEVHIWKVDLAVPASQAEYFASLLSDAEKARAQRYLDPEIGRRFTCGRGILKCLLGLYLQRSPLSMVLETTELGKPHQRVDPNLFFNISHSENAWVLAVATGAEVGVDIERVRSLPNAATMLEWVFPLAEQSALRTLPAEELAERLFRRWTRGEAMLKAQGTGLLRPLREILDADIFEGHSISSPAIYPGHSIAVAVRGALAVLKVWDWSEATFQAAKNLPPYSR